jgi:hypothetical protein
MERISRWAPLLLLPLLVFPLQSATCAQEPKAAEPNPEIGFANDMETAVKLLGYEGVHVLRWRHGLVKGQVTFEGKEGRKTVSFDIEAAAKRRFGKEKGFDPKGFRRLIIIAWKPADKKNPAFCECLVSYVVERTAEKGQPIKGVSSWGECSDGTISSSRRLGSRGISGTAAEAEWFTPGGEEYPIYRFRVIGAE